ncbi:MAG: DUF2061 domain-containing protein [Pseudomonadota bacterium]
MSYKLNKTLTYGVMHLFVAMGVAYAVTGSLAAALAIGLLEPAVQTVAYFFHEKAWGKVATRPDSVTS